MGLKVAVDTLDDLDESVREHYKKDDRSGKFFLDLEDVGALPDVERLNTSLRKERDDHKVTKGKLAPFAALGDPSALQAQLDRIPELEAAAEGKLDDNKLNSIVEGRLKTKLAPLERENAQLKTTLSERDKTIGEFTAGEVRRKVAAAVGKAARELKVVDSAMEDVEILAERVFELTDDGVVITKDGAGTAAGLSPKAWLEDMQARRPHWWGPSAGGGASGNRSGGGLSGGANPWSHEGWNMTEQGEILRTDRAKAERLSKAAGTSIGGRRPPPKK